MSAEKPLWTCPRCGNRFVTRNLWHSCGRFKIGDHFRMVRVRFAGAVVRKRWLDCSLRLTRPIDHPRLTRAEVFGPSSYGQHLRLTEPKEIEARLGALIREAYKIGRQEHLTTKA